MWHTSYFGGLRRLPNYITPIAICRGLPVWWEGEAFEDAAPNWNLVSAYKQGRLSPEEYEVRYREQLDSSDILKKISVYKDDDIAFICYEKPVDFCHRHIFAEWLREHGYEIEEYGL